MIGRGSAVGWNVWRASKYDGRKDAVTKGIKMPDGAMRVKLNC